LAASDQVTRLLRAWGDGDEAALAELVPVVYDEIHRIAHRLRFFGGLTTDEIAAVPEVSPETVMRDWKFAKAWLSRELDTGPAP
jgi:DNA-directed RNA polymerase specialized sigma24 family protein